MKYIFLIFIFFSILGCSFDKSSELWDYKENQIFTKEKTKLSEYKDINFENFKNNILSYANNNDYPDINEKN